MHRNASVWSRYHLRLTMLLHKMCDLYLFLVGKGGDGGGLCLIRI